jgi:xylose isomerase
MSASLFDRSGPLAFDPDSSEMSSFHRHNPGETVVGISVEDHFRLAICYRQSFERLGTDPFQRDWFPADSLDPQQALGRHETLENNINRYV